MTRQKPPLSVRLRALVDRLWAWVLSLYYRVLTIRKEAEIPSLLEPSARALKRVYASCPHIPPDTVSAGIMRGGTALFFTHDDAREVFIGRDYEHAADELIKWIRLQGEELVTGESTNMNRKERRAYAAHYKREGRRQKVGTNKHRVRR